MSTMTVKQGVKTWKDQNQIEPDMKSQVADRNLTAEQKTMLGEEDIGSVLNKVSDPNYVDNSKKVRGVGTNKMDKDAFFKLMMAQMKNQDPSNPLKNHEMAAQLAQFSTLEQMSNMNTTLTEIKGGSKPIEQFQALNLIGKQIAGDSAKVTRSEIDTDHDFKFTLPQDAKTVNVKVVNAKNEPVREFKFSQLKTGENKISWNGENDRGQKAVAGEYRFQVEALGGGGQKLNVKTDFTGVVSGMSFSPEGPVLQVGKHSVRLKDIRQFSDPSLMSNDQKVNDVTQLDLKKNEPMKQTVIKEETKTPEQLRAMSQDAGDLFNQVGMSNELKDKIQKGS